jgi:glycosyltransferase involved in cell wall biosynthesis
MENKITLSVVMPTLNEERAIETVIRDIRTHAENYDTEIIIVDSSTDQTPRIAREMGARVISKPPAGHGDALRTGLAAAQHDIIITADCDNTYPMEYIPRLIALMREGACDLISCNRLTKNLKKEMPFMNKLANRGFAFLVRLLYGIKVNDVTTGMFCLTQNLNRSIKLETFVTVPIELIIKTHGAGFRHREIDIPYRTRVGDVTLQKWRCGKAALLCIFKYRFNLHLDPRQL